MRKRILTLLLVIGLAVTAAPSAMASCFKCALVAAPEVSYCVTVTPPGGPRARTECYSDEFGCTVSGSTCSAEIAAALPLAAEYRVAAIQRLEPQTAPANATAVASAEVKSAR